MPSKSLRFCAHRGCPNLTAERYCPEHASDQLDNAKRYDKQRGTANQRGYKWRWQQASKAFLLLPGNQICMLHLHGCTLIARCVDHIDPPSGPNDPLFWDTTNWQAACVHCNSVKGHTKQVGEYDMMDEIEKD